MKIIVPLCDICCMMQRKQLSRLCHQIISFGIVLYQKCTTTFYRTLSFTLRKVYIYSTSYSAWFTQGAIWGADMGCYLRVDSHSYGKISPRLLKERPHNLTKWTFWAHLHDTSPSFDEKLEEKILEQPTCVFADFWQAQCPHWRNEQMSYKLIIIDAQTHDT